LQAALPFVMDQEDDPRDRRSRHDCHSRGDATRNDLARPLEASSQFSTFTRALCTRLRAIRAWPRAG
jgi:hypothetical protein